MDRFGLAFNNSFFREMEGFYAPSSGAVAPDPKIVLFNETLAQDLGIDRDALNSPQGAQILSGSLSPSGANPLAQVYAGHQFGGFSPQLGDGRALLLGEMLDKTGRRVDLQLKGSGRTQFSRGGDGKAVLGPVLREYILGEAMFGLGIATTRALAAVTTGQDIERDGPQQGAVLARVAASHLRVGTFQYFAAREETDRVRQLADYAISRHYPDLENASDKYFKFLAHVIERQVKLVANWVLVGFVHGVMNTDNMTISGETIDYGPCAFIEHYDPKAVFSSIDRQGRYAYGNQPVMAQWNLARFAETLLPLIDMDLDKAVGKASGLINAIPEQYTDVWLAGMRAKIGLSSSVDSDIDLVNKMLESMGEQHVDFTLFFHNLANALHNQDDELLKLFDDSAQISAWLDLWSDRLAQDGEDMAIVAKRMNNANPIYIARNHLVELSLSAAEKGDYGPLKRLLEVMATPFVAREGFEDMAKPAPDDFGSYTTFCGT